MKEIFVVLLNEKCQTLQSLRISTTKHFLSFLETRDFIAWKRSRGERSLNSYKAKTEQLQSKQAVINHYKVKTQLLAKSKKENPLNL